MSTTDSVLDSNGLNDMEGKTRVTVVDLLPVTTLDSVFVGELVIVDGVCITVRDLLTVATPEDVCDSDAVLVDDSDGVGVVDAVSSRESEGLRVAVAELDLSFVTVSL